MRKMYRSRATAVLVAGIALAASLVGCSSGPAPAAGPEQLTVWGFKGGDLPADQQAGMKGINAAFEAKYPNIKLNYVATASGTPYETKVQTDFLAGDGPDVVMVQGTQLLQMAENGYFADLSKQPWAQDVVKGVRPFVSSGKDLVALPLDATGVGMITNMDLLAKVGVTKVPTDWPTFVEDLGKLKDAGYTPLALPDKNGWTGALTFLSMGATLVPKSWGDDYWNGKGDFSAWKTVLNRLVELDSKGLIDWQNELGVDEFAQGLPNFEAGKTGFWMHGEWNMPDMNSKNMNVEFSAFPAGDAGVAPSVLVFAGAGWAMNKAAKNQDAAEKYLAFFAQPKIHSQYLAAEGSLSTFTNTKSPDVKGTGDFNASYAAGNYSYMPTTTWFGGDVQTQIGSKLQALFLGQISVADTVSALNGIGLKKK